MSKKIDPTQALARELPAVAALKAELLRQLGVNEETASEDDVETLRDTIEGASSIMDLAYQIDLGIMQDESLIKAIDLQVEKLKQRKERLEARIEKHKTMIAHAIEAAAVKTFKLPSGTLTLKWVPPKVVIFDPSAIPATYFKRPDPVVDKTAVNAAMKALLEKREAATTAEERLAVDWIPGCEWSNGQVALSIRRG
jgi:hypothetical protein